MFFRLLTGAVTLVVCSTALGQAPLVSPAISYTRDIQPILTEKCVACHACNDAACQLNLGSAEGATRGASKVPVYQGDRTTAVAPTRIFYDAKGPQAWRNKGFYSMASFFAPSSYVRRKLIHSSDCTHYHAVDAECAQACKRSGFDAVPYLVKKHAGLLAFLSHCTRRTSAIQLSHSVQSRYTPHRA